MWGRCSYEGCVNNPDTILCEGCDDLAHVRCTECAEWYCNRCFGPAENVEAKNPICGECAVNLAHEGIYS
jgi:hypothetical protein